MSEWQSPGTIPRDGTTVFMCRREYNQSEVYLVWWDGDDEFPWAVVEPDGLVNGLDDDAERIVGWQTVTRPAPMLAVSPSPTPPVAGSGAEG